MYQRGNQRILLITQILSKKKKVRRYRHQRGHQTILLISQILRKKESLKIRAPKESSENLINNTDIKKKRKFEDTGTKGVIRKSC